LGSEGLAFVGGKLDDQERKKETRRLVSFVAADFFFDADKRDREEERTHLSRGS